MNHDIIAIGASAGGVDILLDLVQDLPADLQASVFVVMHVHPRHTSELPQLLSARGPLPARHPLHEEKIAPGTIYIAPPDNHLALRPGTMQVVRGPKENDQRPAVNTLFRTASTAYGSRVIGVVLSGFLDCGTAGMLSIKARGGLAVVQRPDSAFAPDMPQSVIDNVAVDHIVHPRELGALLGRLARTPAPAQPATDETTAKLEGDVLGAPSPIVCPICDGALTETTAGHYDHFRCHVGHSFSLASLVREQGDQMERALWAAVRVLEESAALSARIAARERGELAARFAEKARTQQTEANLIREILLRGSTLSDQDASLL